MLTLCVWYPHYTVTVSLYVIFGLSVATFKYFSGTFFCFLLYPLWDDWAFSLSVVSYNFCGKTCEFTHK